MKYPERNLNWNPKNGLKARALQRISPGVGRSPGKVLSRKGGMASAEEFGLAGEFTSVEEFA
jgi:hypothetical protein